MRFPAIAEEDEAHALDTVREPVYLPIRPGSNARKLCSMCLAIASSDQSSDTHHRTLTRQRTRDPIRQLK